MIFYVFTNFAQSAVSLYLSDWSNNADNPDDNKYVRLGVYTALGITQCKLSHASKILLNFNLTHRLYIILKLLDLLLLMGDLCHLKMLMRSARYLHSSMLYSILRSTMQ